MDQLMLDVTDVPEEVKPGDVVTMFGTDGGETITADELAALYGTIGYEIICGISKRVPRRCDRGVRNGDGKERLLSQACGLGQAPPIRGSQ